MFDPRTKLVSDGHDRSQVTSDCHHTPTKTKHHITSAWADALVMWTNTKSPSVLKSASVKIITNITTVNRKERHSQWILSFNLKTEWFLAVIFCLNSLCTLSPTHCTCTSFQAFKSNHSWLSATTRFIRIPLVSWERKVPDLFRCVNISVCVPGSEYKLWCGDVCEVCVHLFVHFNCWWVMTQYFKCYRHHIMLTAPLQVPRFKDSQA